MSFRAALAAGFIALLVTGAAAAQAPTDTAAAKAAPAQGPRPLGPLLQEARSAVEKGRAAGVLELLEQQAQWYAGTPEFDYLLGLAALDAGKAGAAILALERVLAAQPSHLQARAEIGRAYLAAREPEAARRQFEAVVSQPIPPEVRRVIDAYLSGLSRADTSSRSQTSGFVEIALGWDSNVNLGSASSQWLLAGGISVVPERVSQPHASAQSTVNGGFSWLVPIGGAWQWIGGAQVSHRANPAAHTLDASTLDLNTGLGWRSDCHTANMLAQYQHLRIAQDSFRDAAGLLVQWRCDVSSRVQLGLYAQSADFSFARQPVRDARRTQGGMTGAVVLPLPAEAVLVGTAYAGHESPQAEVEQLRYRFQGVRVALNLAPGGNWRWSATASWESRQYAGAEPLFEQTRNDRQWEAGLSGERVIDRHWSLIPQVSTLRNRSNLAPNDFRRSQAQLALRYRF
ncbi:MAG TPA: surface lipoprotein assembly modifier [Burkholderiaceae bacterium]|nr:surface lipoprotein assembly modifier [Burkholderiaceae bacterium]